MVWPILLKLLLASYLHQAELHTVQIFLMKPLSRYSLWYKYIGQQKNWNTLSKNIELSLNNFRLYHRCVKAVSAFNCLGNDNLSHESLIYVNIIPKTIKKDQCRLKKNISCKICKFNVENKTMQTLLSFPEKLTTVMRRTKRRRKRRRQKQRRIRARRRRRKAQTRVHWKRVMMEMKRGGSWTIFLIPLKSEYLVEITWLVKCFRLLDWEAGGRGFKFQAI